MQIPRILFLLAFLLCGTLAMAQTQKKETPEERKARIEKIETAKIAFITDKVTLSAEQAHRFWPLYQEYQDRKDQIRSKSRHFKEENLSKLTDEQIQEGLESRLNYRQAELNIEKEYMDKYLRVISPRQLALFYRAEREFTKLLLERLQTASK
ncbi:hypothetical protein [Rufibacter soli]